jgi:formate dehydrogenase subunit gamma
MGVTKRILLFSFVVFLFNLTTVLVSSAKAAGEDKTGNKSDVVIQQIGVKNPGTDLWREVRQRNKAFEGTTQVKAIRSGELINPKGNEWRKVRREWLMPYGGYFILIVPAILVLFYLIFKKSKIPNGRSGRKVRRMTTMQRIAHWFMVVLVGFLAITGLLLLFGRIAIIPYFGTSAYSVIASASKEGHNLFGPLLVVSLLLMIIYYVRYNFPQKGDLKFLLTAGGLLTKKHLENNYFNGGEKVLFWSTIILLIILSASGLLLLFPYYEMTIVWTQVAIVIHAVAALLLIALTFAHIWMVFSVEGTIDAMVDGTVDENWAKAHHSKWYEKISNNPENFISGSIVEDQESEILNRMPAAEQEGAN